MVDIYYTINTPDSYTEKPEAAQLQRATLSVTRSGDPA